MDNNNSYEIEQTNQLIQLQLEELERSRTLSEYLHEYDRQQALLSVYREQGDLDKGIECQEKIRIMGETLADISSTLTDLSNSLQVDGVTVNSLLPLELATTSIRALTCDFDKSKPPYIRESIGDKLFEIKKNVRGLEEDKTWVKGDGFSSPDYEFFGKTLRVNTLAVEEPCLNYIRELDKAMPYHDVTIKEAKEIVRLVDYAFKQSEKNDILYTYDLTKETKLVQNKVQENHTKTVSKMEEALSMLASNFAAYYSGVGEIADVSDNSAVVYDALQDGDKSIEMSRPNDDRNTQYIGSDNPKSTAKSKDDREEQSL